MTETNDTAEMALEAGELAKQYERAYGICPQCVLTAVRNTAGGVDDVAIQAVHAFAGGGALLGEGLCGALVGGMVLLSLRHGRPRDQMEKGRFMANLERRRSVPSSAA